jgi:hypothetical protein
MAHVFSTNLTVFSIIGDRYVIFDISVATDKCREGFLFHFPHFVNKHELLLSSCLLCGGHLGSGT